MESLVNRRTCTLRPYQLSHGTLTTVTWNLCFQNSSKHVKCPTRGNKILDHCYFTIMAAHRAILWPHFGKSDHLSVFLLPTDRQKVRCAQPTVRMVQCWSTESKFKLQGCFESTDWSILKDSATSLDEYTESVIGYVNFCVDNCILVRTICSYPNQKPLLNNVICLLLREGTTAFNWGWRTLQKIQVWPSRAIKAGTNWKTTTAAVTHGTCGESCRQSQTINPSLVGLQIPPPLYLTIWITFLPALKLTTQTQWQQHRDHSI